MNCKRVLYLGSDREFQKSLTEFYQVRLLNPNNLILSVEEDRFDNFFTLIVEEMPHLVLIDFSNEENLQEDKLATLFRQLHFIKQNSFFKEIAIVGLFVSSQQVREHLALVSSGISYFFVKGTEDLLALLDSCYIGFEQNVPLAEFAKARDLDLPYVAQFTAGVTKIGKSSLILESDLDLSLETSVDISCSLANGEFPQRCEVINRWSVTDNFFFNRYELEIPFCGAWDEPSIYNILEDSYLTWLDFAREEFVFKNGRVLFYVKEKKTLLAIEKLVHQFPHLEIRVDGRESLDLLQLKPRVIFLQLAVSDDEEENLYTFFTKIVSKIKRDVGYRPLIVLFASPSTREALSKVVDYDHLLVSGKVWSEELVTGMFSKLEQKLVDQRVIEHYPLLSEENNVTLALPISITSLTERYITFYAAKNIPMYSLFKLDVPCSLLVTIIPPFDSLPGKESQEHYLGVINGISVEQRALVRRFVNYLIHRRPTEFAWEPEIRESGEEVINEEGDYCLEEANDISRSTTEEMQIGDERLTGRDLEEKLRQRKYKGRSKL